MTLTTAEGEQASEGKALLETAELLFRGDFRLRIPFAQVKNVEAREGVLEVDWAGGKAALELGRAAGRWAEKIRNPRGLLDKLGVKKESRVSILGVTDHHFLQQLRARAREVSLEAGDPVDMLFFGVDDVADLDRLRELRGQIEDAGAVWVVSPKGKGARVRDVDVIEAAGRAGLVDVKVVGFSATHTALKLVVPLALRGGARRRR